MFTSRCAEDQALTIPVKHGEGCWFADGGLLAKLEANGQIVLRYLPGENPNGAVDDGSPEKSWSVAFPPVSPVFATVVSTPTRSPALPSLL